jgi:2-oxoacid:acceptor oxidoreductase delta subunit (pyruvate/2-ketoisovalerate family)
MKRGSISKRIKDLPVTSISDVNTEQNQTGDWRSQTPSVDQGKCNLCGICWMFCPENAIRPKGGQFELLLTYCKGCGICVQECPKKAISIRDGK